MRVMVMVKATKSSEAGEPPSRELLEAMTKYNEELVEAGVMRAGDGLQASSKGVRVRFSGKERVVVDGPFAETNELVAGFWLWEVSSMNEAVEWVKRCPNPMPEDSEIEVRPLYELEDFGEALTSELMAREDRLMLAAKAADTKPGTVTPTLTVKDGRRAIEFYEKAFGAIKTFDFAMPDGRLGHAQPVIGTSIVMLSDEFPECGALSPLSTGGTPVSLYVYVPDVDTVFSRAVSAGAKELRPVADQFYGDRTGHLEDPFGHRWTIATHKENVPRGELTKRLKASSGCS